MGKIKVEEQKIKEVDEVKYDDNKSIVTNKSIIKTEQIKNKTCDQVKDECKKLNFKDVKENKEIKKYTYIKDKDIKEDKDSKENTVLELNSDEITKVELDFSALCSLKKEIPLDFIKINSIKVKEIICKICDELIDNNTVHEHNHVWIGDLIKKELYKENIKNIEDWLYGKKINNLDSKEDYKKRNTNYYKENNLSLAFREAQKEIIKKYNGKFKLLDLSNVDMSFHIKILIGGRKIYLKDENSVLWHNHNTDNYF